MDHPSPAILPTRRTALMIAAAALPGWPQSSTTQPTGGDKKMSCPVVHFEIGCRDKGKTSRFFADLFGWQMAESGPAVNIATGSDKGIQGHITSLGHEPEHYVTFYVQVDDIQAYLDKVKELGGKVLLPPIKIPTGTFSWFMDPDGNVVGLLQPPA